MENSKFSILSQFASAAAAAAVKIIKVKYV